MLGLQNTFQLCPHTFLINTKDATTSQHSYPISHLLSFQAPVSSSLRSLPLPFACDSGSWNTKALNILPYLSCHDRGLFHFNQPPAYMIRSFNQPPTYVLTLLLIIIIVSRSLISAMPLGWARALFWTYLTI